MSEIFPGHRRPILVYPSTAWFNLPVTKDVALAPTPGTPSATSMAEYGRVSVPEPATIERIHLHQDVDGNAGTTVLELYRRRLGVMTLIATATLAHGGGDFGFTDFTMVSDDLRSLERGDYLMMQATDKMGGSPVGFVDVHFEAIRK